MPMERPGPQLAGKVGDYRADARWFYAGVLGRETSLLTVAVLVSICFILINLLQKRDFPKIETENVLHSLAMVSVLSGTAKLYCGRFL